MITKTTTITALGKLGDGLALLEGKQVHVPFTAPGDEVSIEITSGKPRLLEVLTPSPHRQTPPCPHFTHCGGCSLQHIDTPTYQNFKRERMQYALQRAGLRELPEAKYVQVPTHSRRHATFHVGRDGKLGFYAPRSHQVIELTSCEVLSVKLFAAYQFCAAHFATIEIDRIGLTEYPQGVDVDLYCSARPTQIDKWRILAEQQGLLRLNVVTQDKFETTTSELPPPGSFVQATFAGEEAIQAAIKAAVGERPEQAIVDFYAGLGNSTLALTELGHSVLAFEGDAAMVGYLEKIHPGTFQRDLVKSPWPAAKLRHTDVALVNPPYNGALPQTEEIAAAKVPTVVMISCNPVTLERDLKALVLAGYKVSAVTLIDQFLWSMHIEAVVVCRLQR